MSEFETEALRLLAVIAENTNPENEKGVVSYMSERREKDESIKDYVAGYSLQSFSREMGISLRKAGN